MKCIQFILQAMLVISSVGWISCAEPPSHFAVDMYKRIAEEKHGENFVVSSFCIRETFGMLLPGARENTNTQLKSVLRLDSFKTESDIYNEFKKNLDILNRPDNIPTFDLANRVFASEEVTFNKTYLSNLKKYFHSIPERLDFQGNPEESLNHINDWVSNETNGMINDLLPRGSISDRTKLVLTNAIYFNASWKIPFNPESTEEAEFRVSESDSDRVAFMHLPATTLNYSDSEILKSQILELKYLGDRVSMFIALPHKNVDISKVETLLTAKTLIAELARLKQRQVKVTLPKFQIDQPIEVKQHLKSMGLTDVFDPKRADLSGISKKVRLHVNDVYHKAFFSVTEFGTEATAATSDDVTIEVASTGGKSVEFKADRPFLFMITAEGTSLPLFCGRFVGGQERDK